MSCDYPEDSGLCMFILNLSYGAQLLSLCCVCVAGWMDSTVTNGLCLFPGLKREELKINTGLLRKKVSFISGVRLERCKEEGLTTSLSF